VTQIVCGLPGQVAENIARRTWCPQVWLLIQSFTNRTGGKYNNLLKYALILFFMENL